MIDPSKEKWDSAVYFLFFCEKNTENYRVTASQGKKKTQTGSVEAIFGLKLAKEGKFW